VLLGGASLVMEPNHPSEARASIGRCLGFYNSRRPHSSLDGKTPDQPYFNLLMPQAVAA
jgi:putative transposase